MANTDIEIGFVIADPEKYTPIPLPLNGSEGVSKGDVVYLGTDGRISATRVSGYIAGVAASEMINGLTGEIVAASSASESRGDYVLVWADPDAEFIGQESSFALTDPYTTHTSASCFDIAGTTGVQYIDASSSTYDEVQILCKEADIDGEISETGAYAKVRFKFNKAKHAFGICA